MPFGYGVGDHRAFILDITIESLIGVDPVKIVRPVGRQLNSRLAGCCKAYIDSFEANITWHCLLEQLYDAHTGAHSDEDRAKNIMIIDKEGKKYMRRAEKICQKIKCCCIPFLPEATIWIRRVQVYSLILRYHKGKIKKLRKSEMRGPSMQYPGPAWNVDPGDSTLVGGMQKGMPLLPGAQ
jgi:hypothetical protein